MTVAELIVPYQQVPVMLKTSSDSQQQQLRVVQRLYRICSNYRRLAGTEPCLEQYESQVRLMMDEEVTPAASAWIELIAQSLRTGTDFAPEEYLRA
ncbi:MAG: hypothetical protein R3C49_08925 [Planctomycetaceae bacterium]